jgi:hypothetical protein
MKAAKIPDQKQIPEFCQYAGHAGGRSASVFGQCGYGK